MAKLDVSIMGCKLLAYSWPLGSPFLPLSNFTFWKYLEILQFCSCTCLPSRHSLRTDCQSGVGFQAVVEWRILEGCSKGAPESPGLLCVPGGSSVQVVLAPTAAWAYPSSVFLHPLPRRTRGLRRGGQKGATCPGIPSRR